MKKAIRLDKLLAGAGYGSRKEIKKITKGGKVTVNGQTVTDSSCHVSPDADRVTVNGTAVIYREFVYLMLNKPAGFVSATVDARDRTVLEFVPEEFRHYELFLVGRLDKDTEGLLLLTNDGKLAHEVLAPKRHVPKTYYVKVDGQVHELHGQELARGVTLDDGYQTKPAGLNILAAGTVSEVELTIYEGRFHQVKRMFASLGMTVLYLKRVTIGGVALDPSLKPGQMRELTTSELQMLKMKHQPAR